MKKIIIYLIGIIVATTATINLANAQSNESDIIITEILYNPPGNDTIEFIEIYNAGSAAYNLNGYKLSGPFNYTFGQVDIQPNTYYVIANDSARMRRVFGLITGHWGTSNSLANADRMIKIVDAGQNLVDSLHYYNVAPWPAIGTNAGGHSIELNNTFSDNSDGARWKLSTTFGTLLNNGATLCCSPGQANLPYLPETDFSTQTRIANIGSTISFQDNSFGDNLTYGWNFQGGNPSTSTTQNPSVLYSNYGIFDVGLTITNSEGMSTMTKENYIGIFHTECQPITSFPFEETFNSAPQCWIMQSAVGGGGWALSNNFGYEDNTSIKFDCTALPANATSKAITPKLNFSSLPSVNLNFKYFADINSSTPPIIKIIEFSENMNVINSQNIALTAGSWMQYSQLLSVSTSYIAITAINKPNNVAIFIDDFSISNRPANSFKISGYIKDANSNLIDNLLISINPTTSTHTNQSGYYEFFVQKSWSGIVRAENPQYVYSPEYHQIIDIQADIEDLDFEAALLPSGWIFHKTVNSHSFCILNNAFPSGNEIPFGSWIGVFYKDASNNEKCCGAIQYTTIDTYCLNAWGANSQTGDEGYTEGGEIIWKLFDSNSGTITDVNVEYSSGHTVFQNDGLSIINSFNLDITTQTLVIPEGWSGISSYVIPDNLLLESIFSNHLSKIIAITNDNGIFLPSNPNSTLSNWNAESGWLIKCTENIVVPFTGGLTNNMNVSFPVGWTLFPIKTNEPILIADLFSGMLNNIDIVKGYGYNEIYIPGISGDFMLIPGKAYKARMNTATTVTFGFSKGFSGNGIHEYTETLEKSVQEDVAQTSSDHVFVFIDAQNLKVGDVISAFTSNGLLVGSGEVSGNFTAIFKAFGDDFTTSSIDGLAENERVRFKITRDNKTYSINIQFAQNTINHDYFVNDGISYISKVRINFDGIEEYSSAINVYPNPAKDIVHVRISDNLYVNSSEIKIFDFTGKLIKKLEYQIGQTAEIYVGDLAKGIYNINYVNRNIIFVKE